MLSNFITYIQQEQLLRLSRDRILLAVSGGMDSIAMLRLFQKARIKFGIAHCNFQLRGQESNEDEAFVAALAEELQVPYFNIKFNTEQESILQKKSIQVVARDLRYEWLEKIRQEQGFDSIAVAHHHNDSIETLVLNLTMGCGIRGLHGILPKNGFIIRPLLFANRAEIQQYISENKFAYREDSSNASTKYTRNAIRHLIVPELQKINPNLEKTFEENFQRFRETEALYNYAIETLKGKFVHEKNGFTHIDIQGVANSPSPLSFLFELLSPFNFKASKITTIYNERTENSGELYNSKTHQVLRDRTHWIVSPIVNNKGEQYSILEFANKSGSFDFGSNSLHWEIIPKPDSLKTDFQKAYFDLKKLKFPLYLRHWKEGDIFYPLGMNGQSKKISKFYKDIKLNLFEKDATWLLCDANQEIVWVIGQREDERFKVDESSEEIVLIDLKIG